MPNFPETRETLLHAHSDNVIDVEEFVLLFDLNTSKNPDIEYWKYHTFDLNFYDDDNVVAQLPFMKKDIPRLGDALDLPNELNCHLYNDLVVDSAEALCIVLSRLAYPCRYLDMVSLFGRSVPQLNMIFNQTTGLIDSSHNHGLSDLNQGWLSPRCLKAFANSIHRKGAALDNVWGIIARTVQPCCRPKVNQRIFYNGHKRLHALKCQSVTIPSGMVTNLFGPAERKKHDCAILAMSGLLLTLQRYPHGPNGKVPCNFEDPAYPLRRNLLALYNDAQLTQEQMNFNSSMNKVRVTVEQMFGEVIHNFKFTDFKKNLEIGLSCVGKFYRVSAILTNAHSCLYKSNVSQYFAIDPPLLEEYFQ